jgi:hypothetical protein
MSYQQIVRTAEDYLTEVGGAKSGPDIAAHLEGLMNEGVIERHPKTVIFSYLSRAANQDENSRLLSGGPHGGYSLELTEEPTDTGPEEIHDNRGVSQSQTLNPIEKHLYPLITTWLQANGYISEDVSALKSGGQWGNPDILGVMRVEILGASEIELVSVEAKLSEVGWERFIFEAVSHKRFANRSWFCYRTSTPYPPLPKNMAYYAERYKVGIIQIHLSDAELEQLAGSPSESAVYLERIQERVRALYEAVPLQEKRAFLSRAKMELNLHVIRGV